MEKITLVLIIIQIITESLPISSSGHIILIKLFAKKKLNFQNVFFPEYLDDFLHGSALIVIFTVFFKDWFYPFQVFLQSLYQLLFTSKKLTFVQKKLILLFFKITGFVLVANIVTSFFYLLLKILYKDFFVNKESIFSIYGFFITMILLFSLRFRKQTKFNALDFKKSLILGFVQGIALLPGISRFAITYTVGYWLNIKPMRAFQISFLLQFPLLLTAFSLHGLPYTLKNSLPNYSILLILVISTILAVIFLKICYKLATKNKLWWLGFYMLIPIIILIYLK